MPIADFFLAGTLSMLRFSGFHNVNNLTTLQRRRCVDYDFFSFALVIEHAHRGGTRLYNSAG